MRIILPVFLFLLVFPAFSHAYVIQSDTRDQPFYNETWAGYGSNYNWGVGVTQDGLVTGVNTVYFDTCANAYPASSIDAFIYNINAPVGEQRVQTAFDYNIKLCSSYASTTQDVTEFSEFYFNNATIGAPQQGDELVFVIRASGNDFRLGSGDSTLQGYRVLGCTAPDDDQYECSNYSSNRTVGYGFASDTPNPIDYPDVDIAGNNYFTYDTRFLDGFIDFNSSGNIRLNVDYYLNTDEYNASNRPDTIWWNVTKLAFPTDEPNIVNKQKYILPLETGTSTLNISNSNITTADDGKYVSNVIFWNALGQRTTFSDTSISIEFEIDNGIIVDSSIVGLYNSLTPDNLSTSGGNDCEFSLSGFRFGACITQLARVLFIPSQGSIQSAFNNLGAQDNPLIAPAYLAFNSITSASNASPDGNTLAYSLQIPQAGLDVEMVSINTITQLFGPSLPMFRSIMILVIWFGFFNMVIGSVWGRIGGPRDETDFSPEAFGPQGSGTQSNTLDVSGGKWGKTLDLRR